MNASGLVRCLFILSLHATLAASCGGEIYGPGDAGTGGGGIDSSAGGGIDSSCGADRNGPIHTSGSYDGTSGQPCTSEADCDPPGGPGENRCTIDNVAPVGLYPTPVCLDGAPCQPGTDGNPHFCDGPDDPSSPGVCVPDGAGGGNCMPQCQFSPDGMAPVGCLCNDVCAFYMVTADPSGASLGIGYCVGGCQTDADCSTAGLTAPFCQTDMGVCVSASFTPEPPGTSCNVNSLQSSPPCNCIVDESTGLGYCAPFCVVGGAACPCGTTCDSSLPAGKGWTVPNPGMAGVCLATCQPDGGSCPPNSTCRSPDLAGLYCFPQ
jgi:hypothetical protein